MFGVWVCMQLDCNLRIHVYLSNLPGVYASQAASIECCAFVGPRLLRNESQWKILLASQLSQYPKRFQSRTTAHGKGSRPKNQIQSVSADLTI